VAASLPGTAVATAPRRRLPPDLRRPGLQAVGRRPTELAVRLRAPTPVRPLAPRWLVYRAKVCLQRRRVARPESAAGRLPERRLVGPRQMVGLRPMAGLRLMRSDRVSVSPPPRSRSAFQFTRDPFWLALRLGQYRRQGRHPGHRQGHHQARQRRWYRQRWCITRGRRRSRSGKLCPRPW